MVFKNKETSLIGECINYKVKLISASKKFLLGWRVAVTGTHGVASKLLRPDRLTLPRSLQFFSSRDYEV